MAVASGFVHELTSGIVPSVIFGADKNRRHGNFHPASYRNICANPEWARRLSKVHTASRRTRRADSWQWKELDCANSSDALLMNIFCHQPSVRNPALAAFLSIEPGTKPQFGFRPRIPLRDGKTDRTEIDMRLGNLLVEAKLTETNFQNAPVRLLERYRDFDEIFDREALPHFGELFTGYQLIRGVLAAHAAGGAFSVICDARRPDLVETWYGVMRAIRSCIQRCQSQLVTWQELGVLLTPPLQQFLAKKYGIVAA
ncbi:MAG TPA: hypothetical protein VI386_21075 [Candidatus Sulfotelmatobacter sp.]